MKSFLYKLCIVAALLCGQSVKSAFGAEAEAAGEDRSTGIDVDNPTGGQDGLRIKRTNDDGRNDLNRNREQNSEGSRDATQKLGQGNSLVPKLPGSSTEDSGSDGNSGDNLPGQVTPEPVSEELQAQTDAVLGGSVAPVKPAGDDPEAQAEATPEQVSQLQERLGQIVAHLQNPSESVLRYDEQLDQQGEFPPEVSRPLEKLIDDLENIQTAQKTVGADESIVSFQKKLQITLGELRSNISGTSYESDIANFLDALDAYANDIKTKGGEGVAFEAPAATPPTSGVSDPVVADNNQAPLDRLLDDLNVERLPEDPSTLSLPELLDLYGKTGKSSSLVSTIEIGADGSATIRRRTGEKTSVIVNIDVTQEQKNALVDFVNKQVETIQNLLLSRIVDQKLSENITSMSLAEDGIDQLQDDLLVLQKLKGKFLGNSQKNTDVKSLTKLIEDALQGDNRLPNYQRGGTDSKFITLQNDTRNSIARLIANEDDTVNEKILLIMNAFKTGLAYPEVRFQNAVTDACVEGLNTLAKGKSDLQQKQFLTQLSSDIQSFQDAYANAVDMKNNPSFYKVSDVTLALKNLKQLTNSILINRAGNKNPDLEKLQYQFAKVLLDQTNTLEVGLRTVIGKFQPSLQKPSLWQRFSSWAKDENVAWKDLIKAKVFKRQWYGVGDGTNNTFTKTSQVFTDLTAITTAAESEAQAAMRVLNNPDSASTVNLASTLEALDSLKSQMQTLQQMGRSSVGVELYNEMVSRISKVSNSSIDQLMLRVQTVMVKEIENQFNDAIESFKTSSSYDSLEQVKAAEADVQTAQDQLATLDALNSLNGSLDLTKVLAPNADRKTAALKEVLQNNNNTLPLDKVLSALGVPSRGSRMYKDITGLIKSPATVLFVRDALLTGKPVTLPAVKLSPDFIKQNQAYLDQYKTTYLNDYKTYLEQRKTYSQQSADTVAQGAQS